MSKLWDDRPERKELETALARIAELEAAVQKIVDLDSDQDHPVAYSWGLEYFRRAHAIAKAALDN